MNESGQGKKSRLFSRPGALLVDDRPLKIDLPTPPAITLTPPRMEELSAPPVAAPPPPAPEPEPEPEDEPSAGPARLFVGGPRVVSPTAVRAVSAASEADDPPPWRRAAAEEDWRSARAPREERVPWSGLDRSARTVAEDVNGRLEREKREQERLGRPAGGRPAGTRPAGPRAWDAMAQESGAPHGAWPRWSEPEEAPAAGVTPPPRDPEEYAPEPPAVRVALARAITPEEADAPATPLPALALPTPSAPRAAPPARVAASPVVLPSERGPLPEPAPLGPPPRGAAARELARAARPLAQEVSEASEDEFFGDRTQSPTRTLERRLQPTFPDEEVPRSAGPRFVPRNQRPNARKDSNLSAAWLAALGILLLGAALLTFAWRVKKQVAEPDSVGNVASAVTSPEAPPTKPPEATVDADLPPGPAAPSPAPLGSPPDIATAAGPQAATPPNPTTPPATPPETPISLADLPSGHTSGAAANPSSSVIVAGASSRPGVAVQPSKPAGSTGLEKVDPGFLLVVTDQAARVKVDGKSLGTVSGSKSFELPPGVHTVKITPTRGGRTQSLDVRIDSGRPTQIGFKLK